MTDHGEAPVVKELVRNETEKLRALVESLEGAQETSIADAEVPARQQDRRVWSISDARSRGLLAVLALFAISRVGCAIAGVRFDISALRPATWSQVQWQLLRLPLLHQDLLRSVWYLHSQPPLYNLVAGLILHLPTSAQQAVAACLFLGLGLILAFSCYFLLLEVRLRPTMAAAVTALVCLNPATVLYENWMSWTYPTAVLLTLGLFSATRLVRTGAARWSALSFGSLVAVILLDSTFQWVWLVIAAVPIVMVTRRHWRRVLLGAAIPLLLLTTWTIKDLVLFGSPSSSTWLGMNLAHMTLTQAPPAQIESLVARHRLSSLATEAPFEPLDSYVPEYVEAAGPTGVAALDEATTEFGSPNFNNITYVKIAGRYLGQAISYVRAEPGTYAGTVQRAVYLWMVPADQYPFLLNNFNRIRPYASWFNHIVLVQPQLGDDRVGLRAENGQPGQPGVALKNHQLPSALSISWLEVVLTVVGLVGGLRLVLRRTNHVGLRVSVFLLWLTTVYAFAITSAADIGENMRYGFEIGPVPVVLTAAVLSEIIGNHRPANASVTG